MLDFYNPMKIATIDATQSDGGAASGVLVFIIPIMVLPAPIVHDLCFWARLLDIRLSPIVIGITVGGA